MLDFASFCLAAALAAGPGSSAVAQTEAGAEAGGASLDDAVVDTMQEDAVQEDAAQVDGAQMDSAPARVEPTTCTYRTYNWSTEERRAVNRRTVEKDYADVVDDERSPQDPRCTVCSEDQAEIDPSAFGLDIEPFSVCWVYRDAIESALRTIAESGEFRFTEITGYRPGRTRGRVVDGLRTEWSNHSFGTAIDINADRNGLYRSCNVDEVNADTIRDCRLGVGGEWDPEGDPSRTITRGSIVYDEFIETVGWRWGGEISGSTRDMMHFSPTGE